MAKLKILFIPAPYDTFRGRKRPFDHLGVLYLANTLEKAGYWARVYHADAGVKISKKEKLYSQYKRRRTARNELFKRNFENNDFHVWKELEKTIITTKPSIVGISFTTMAYPSAIKIAGMIKRINKNITIIAGGCHATTQPEQVIKQENIDLVVRGEAEHIITPLVKAIENNITPKKISGLTYQKNNRIIHTPNQKPPQNLDELPFPQRNVLINSKGGRIQKYIQDYALITSRGCPYNCAFCATEQHRGKPIRFRSPDNVMEEIKTATKKHGTKYFMFVDETFTFDKKRVRTLCKLILWNKLKIRWLCNTRIDKLDKRTLRLMRKAGCDLIYLGIESGDARMLIKMKKGIKLEQIKSAVKLVKGAGIRVGAYLIIGYPGETNKSLKNTTNLLKEIKPDITGVFFATPFPGTELYGIAKSSLLTTNYSKYNTQTQIIKSQPVSGKELQKKYEELNSFSKTTRSTKIRVEILKSKIGYFLSNRITK
jgi:radical SAM superfamily enzyme YgiQ (UPF0313 family)